MVDDTGNIMVKPAPIGLGNQSWALGAIGRLEYFQEGGKGMESACLPSMHRMAGDTVNITVKSVPIGLGNQSWMLGAIGRLEYFQEGGKGAESTCLPSGQAR